MLLVEGPDGAGKTTLVQWLSDALDWPIAERVVTQDTEAMVDLKCWVDENLAKGWHETIYDRHRLISEPIYGPIMRHSLEPGFDDLSWLHPRVNTLYRGIRPVIVYCLPPLSIVRGNVEGDPNNHRVAAKIDSIYGAYCSRVAHDMCYRISGCATIIWYDYTAQSHTKNELLRKVYLGMSEGNL